MAVTRGPAVGRTVRRIAGVSLTSADADVLASFYERLGFVRTGVELRGGPAFARMTGLSGAEARVILLTLGKERLELVSFSEPGRPYPRERASNDPWFQHFAIVVASMEEAYARLRACAGWTPVSRSAPQRLPERSGGVTAFKFRDPEGHPLELLEFPEDRIPSVWRERRDERRAARDSSESPPGGGAPRRDAPAPFLGIDHSAIVVTSSSRSIEFYEQRLGFVRSGGSLNQGPEQAALDDLSHPEVEVTALAPAAQPPHLELLCYRARAATEEVTDYRQQARAAGESSSAPLASNDIAATQLLLVEDRAPGPDTAPGMLIHDPDAHALMLTLSE